MRWPLIPTKDLLVAGGFSVEAMVVVGLVGTEGWMSRTESTSIDVRERSRKLKSMTLVRCFVLVFVEATGELMLCRRLKLDNTKKEGGYIYTHT